MLDLAASALRVTDPEATVLTRQTCDSDLLAPLWALLADEKFRASVEALGGYSCAETGARVC